jgi:2-oxo-4-hydroxy-4-carboxy-5-ureidoimidazoline decarboxylase
MTFDELNALDEEAAADAFLRCCGSSRWARLMAAARPFRDADAMSATADAVWLALDRADWLEAFAAHPRIGAGGAARAGEAGGAGAPRPGEAAEAGKAEEAGEEGRIGAHWSDDEQRAVVDAGSGTRRRLAEANREYEARFGYIFIVCATGRTAAEMLGLLEGRLRHDAGDELQVAAEEQRRITQLRLRKLVEREPDALS